MALGSCGGDVYFIPGSGTLPDCAEAPAANLDGSVWFDQGTVTIRSGGCQEAMSGDTFNACALDWAFAQDGNDVTIIVDGEYRIEGRLCGDQLSLHGGWWLPVEDQGMCTYADDSAEEVGIMAEGNVLTVTGSQMTGTLVVQGSCSGDYEVLFMPVPSTSLN